jgi:hypothetical protein
MQAIIASKYGKLASDNWEQVARQDEVREETRAKQLRFGSSLGIRTDEAGAEVPQEKAEEIQQTLDTYKLMLEATEHSIKGVTNEQRARLFALLESNINLDQEDPCSIPEMMSKLNITEEEATEILEYYYGTGNVFTQADIEGNLAELAFDDVYSGKKTMM